MTDNRRSTYIRIYHGNQHDKIFINYIPRVSNDVTLTIDGKGYYSSNQINYKVDYHDSIMFTIVYALSTESFIRVNELADDIIEDMITMCKNYFQLTKYEDRVSFNMMRAKAIILYLHSKHPMLYSNVVETVILKIVGKESLPKKLPYQIMADIREEIGSIHEYIFTSDLLPYF